MILGEILRDDFVNVKKIYEIAEQRGIKKAEIKAEKRKLGVKSAHIISENGADMWLWYLPKKIWEKYHV